MFSASVKPKEHMAVGASCITAWLAAIFGMLYLMKFILDKSNQKGNDYMYVPLTVCLGYAHYDKSSKYCVYGSDHPLQ